MATEVAEDTFVKLSKEEVGYLKTFYATATVSNAAEVWKKKSVSIVSPKSGRIFGNKKNSEKKPKSEQNGERTKESFFKRLFEDFKKAKVSDYAYQQSNVRRNSSYKPFWATKVVEPVAQPNVDEPEMSSKKIDLVQHSNAVSNRSIIFAKEVIGSPKVTLSNVKKASRESTPMKRLSTVDHHKEYRLRMPPSYRGSQMFMPTGEQLFWVRYLF